MKLLKTALSMVNRENQIELLNVAWKDGFLNYPQMVELLWELKISSRHIKDFDLFQVLIANLQKDDTLKRFNTSFANALRVRYLTSRSYYTDDLAIEILHGMHRGILKGEVNSAALS